LKIKEEHLLDFVEVVQEIKKEKFSEHMMLHVD